MPTDRWSDADRELVAEVLWRFPSKTTTRAAATSVLDALTGAGWRDAEHVAMLRTLVADLTDPDPCWYDHHGYCQAHGWLATDPPCPHARAQELLRKGPEDA